MGKPVDMVQGTLDVLILKAIRPAPLHGWAIAQRINQLSHDVLRVQQGSLYPALQRLEREGWIRAEWGESENNRRARFYTLTAAGRRHLEREQAVWERLLNAIALVLRTA
jgi:PadR family transcriptional regulator, regulatory protein PadR